jgi:Tfp pilus assembly protein PilN
MRAVNLIPAEERRGAGGLAGRSGGVVYVLTGALAALVALAVVYALAVHSVANHKTQLATVTAQVAAVQAETQTLQPYVEVATISEDKVQQVVSIAEQRFNWPMALDQLALALPDDVSFTTLAAGAAGATGAPGATSAPASGSGNSFDLTGCANSQGELPAVLTDLASVPGVTDVALASSVESSALKFHALSTALKHGGPEKADVPPAGTCPKITWTVTLDYASTYTVPKVKLPQGSSSAAQTVSTSSGPRSTIEETASRRVSK